MCIVKRHINEWNKWTDNLEFLFVKSSVNSNMDAPSVASIDHNTCFIPSNITIIQISCFQHC